MRWILIVVIGVAVLVVASWVVGLLLPKGHTAARTLHLKQQPEAVWGVISDAQAMPSWRLNVAKVERLADQNGHPVWRETYKNGQALPLELVETLPPKRLVGRIAEVTDMGQHTRAVIEFNAVGRKTLILQYARLEPVGT